MFRFTHERARIVEIARQRRAEQARLAKLEEQRVEYLDRKLAQPEQRDRLRTFLMTLPADSISEETFGRRRKVTARAIHGPRSSAYGISVLVHLPQTIFPSRSELASHYRRQLPA
ncbi:MULTISPECIES: hypothetical protein [unclassified Mesorhizobium]|uniref:hypothetical protein n=1 Tax=unclassified Mesorhizobium TaxID=325217 RepID=UPI001127A6D6|nr:MULTISPECIES: hypothetical protein [unclassified Mesorhizobium]MBZ9916644.1 hypothetical protein [Mesorhizobium sp. BR1-1-7]MBZ9954456.1 hypothetical protein [Mesorhizobium sp. BR1-1-15]MBZ9971579.1 hypothetical protein [Mesorhizobium sp. BR1-1-12]MCA0055469.1 hypothetical protein [Mesorhizobium sp. B261B1A]TPK32343.1 hypothetical protein FJ867_21560 [Mesorhizobium sp. B2-5-3]